MGGNWCLPGDEAGRGVDSIIDPRGAGPRIWFRVTDAEKAEKNRSHIDVHASTDPPYLSNVRRLPMDVGRQRVDAEAKRLAELGASITGPLGADGLDHYAVGMLDPEGNEFDIN